MTIIFSDLAKAIATKDHKIFLDKLNNFIRGNADKLFDYYLGVPFI